MSDENQNTSVQEDQEIERLKRQMHRDLLVAGGMGAAAVVGAGALLHDVATTPLPPLEELPPAVAPLEPGESTGFRFSQPFQEPSRVELLDKDRAPPEPRTTYDPLPKLETTEPPKGNGAEREIQ